MVSVREGLIVVAALVPAHTSSTASRGNARVASTVAAESTLSVNRCIAVDAEGIEDVRDSLLCCVVALYKGVCDGVEESLLVLFIYEDVVDGALEDAEEGVEGNCQNVAEECLHGCVGDLG